MKHANSTKGLKLAIKRAGGSQKALADKIGCHQTQVGYWLKTGKVHADWLEAIESATLVSPRVIRPDLKNILK
jgi:DNA-binding transcriptional regulator YdaS (Cro superfamily)